MYRPYTNSFATAVAIAAEVVGVALTSALWSCPLRTRQSTVSFSVAIVGTALSPALVPALTEFAPKVPLFYFLQALTLFATWAMLRQRSHALKALAVTGQGLLWLVSDYVKESDHELIFLYLFWYGLLFGVHLLTTAAPRRADEEPDVRSFVRYDAGIFVVTTAVALFVTCLLFDRFTANGDEIANTFQADVYAHLRAYAPIPPCPRMFANYWVFHYQGRAFSQYTPGWPLFMAVFSRLGIVYAAGPVMGGIMAVGVARLSRRLASGLAVTASESQRIMNIAGVLGALSAVLGPSMLLNAASRFSHTMVCACFAWSVESLCVVSERGISRRRAWAYGLLLGSAAALGVATRPADGGFLGVGVFLYFLWALKGRRIQLRGLFATLLGFAAFAGLTAVILRLQLGAWFQTGYTIAPSIHPETALRLSWPKPNEVKFGVPLAIGSYTWWPAAPALGIAGLVRALGGRERRVAFMLAVGAVLDLTFYFFVEFGRYGDDGLGPRYFLALVVPMATGGAALLAPVLSRIVPAGELPFSWLRRMVPALLTASSILCGVVSLGPLVYPHARAESEYTTAPFRAAKKLVLKNAAVLLKFGRTYAYPGNLAQNPPMNPTPDVLFMSTEDKAEEACLRKHFPGRTWYWAEKEEKLTPY